MKCGSVHDMTIRCRYAQHSRRACCANVLPSQYNALRRSRLSLTAAAVCYGVVAEHAVSVSANRGASDVDSSREAPRAAGARRPPRRFIKRPVQDEDDDAGDAKDLHLLIRPSISGSPNPQEVARGVLFECKTTKSLLKTVKSLPESCRCGSVAAVAFLVAKRLHQETQHKKVKRKDLRETGRLLAFLDQLGSSSFDSLTLSECTTVAASISELRPSGASLRSCVHVLLDTASSRIAQAVSLGPEGTAAAADTACALVAMLAHCTALVDQQNTKGSIHQSCAAITDAASSLTPLDLAAALSSLSKLSTPQHAIKETCHALLERISFLEQNTSLSPSDAAALASACAHTTPPQIHLAGRLVDTITAETPVEEQPLVAVLVPLAECHAAVWRHAGATAAADDADALNSRSSAAESARQVAGLLRMRAHELPPQLAARVLRAFGSFPVSTATRRAFLRALLDIPAGAGARPASDSSPVFLSPTVQRLISEECVELLEAVCSLQLPIGDSTVSAAAIVTLEQLVYVRPYVHAAAAALCALGKLHFSVVDSDRLSRHVSMLCGRVRNSRNPPPSPPMLLSALQGLAGIQSSWQSSLPSRTSADILGSLLPHLSSVPPSALADLTAAIGALDLSTQSRATFIVALEAALTESEFQGLSARAASKLLKGLSGIYTASTKYHVEHGRGLKQFGRIPEPQTVSTQPPSAALDALVQRAAVRLTPHALGTSELATACDALARLEAPQSVAAPIVYAAVGAAERDMSTLRPVSTVNLVRGLSAFIEVVRVPAAFLAVLDTHIIACMPCVHAEGIIELSYHWPVTTPPGPAHKPWSPRRLDLMHAAVERCIELLPSLEPFDALQLVQAVSRIAKRAAVDLGPRKYQALLRRGRLGDLTVVAKGVVATAVEEYVDSRLPFAKAREEKYLRLMCSASGIISGVWEEAQSPRGYQKQGFY